jgi:hypothetical protein
MQKIRTFVFLLLCCFALGWAAAELRRPSLLVSCAECGNGPKDKKCPDGYKCVDSKCVKR